MSTYEYDFFVIGAGSGGVRAARTAAALGARTGIAEARFFGGTCVNVGCIPKKLYTYAAHTRHDIADSAAYGWHTQTPPVFEWSLLKQNKDKEIKRLNGIYKNLLSAANVDIHEGHARISGANRVTVGDREITAKHILVAVGGQSFMPPVPGIEHAMDSDDFFELTSQPATVLIVGGGYIATELAGVFSGLGTEVTLAYRGDSLLNGFDEDIRTFFTDAIKSYTHLKLNSDIERIDTLGDQKQVLFADGSKQTFDAVLYATGRVPATANLGLADHDVRLSDVGAIIVDGNFETSMPGVYAVGDVIDRVTLTPVALAEGQALARRLFGGPEQRVSYDLVPAAVFSDPQIATVGMTEAEARSCHQHIEVYRSRFRPLKHTLTGRESFSLMKMLVDKETDRVVGMHMAGDDAAEIMQGMAVAMQVGATKAQFDLTIGIHPTAAEEFVTMRTPVDD
ncbi:glutathione-disulfide reductase [Pseudohongiella sp.]|uniref:Glutathione-disulfide reductase n=1 Tax=marine sediment metagenome TaxID=412755 RepID=A0A0F9YE87_9ZZZZ|nr:glutathione-disulfide reductase [Pseudohongiella sp.]HDZ09759.1 glutathione-disulfide reductase [Pseudohongiella sp.]HEA61627.1 glutathione-disulfide reductase [Pseudohongiella sp.]